MTAWRWYWLRCYEKSGLEKPDEDQRWDENEKYKSKRYWLIHASYVTLGAAICATSIYLVLAIIGS